MVMVLPANVQDRDGARQLLQRCLGFTKRFGSSGPMVAMLDS